ncbi:4-hydroxy-3-methylbut-2-enyl diphosphate reductase [Candidatus Poribacteria bacterium]|nr:4-hydroxy-3-methylbut-2-enyl diphosphate reductase [Candidatus Poribacteria bacterium]
MKRAIQVTDQAGYCFGVRRALDMVKDYLSEKTKKVYSLGPIIHNPEVVEELRKKGLATVNTLDDVEEGVVVIRSHGVEKKLLDEIHRKGLEIVDATCPFVRNAQRLAQKLSEDGYQVVIVGEQAHPEVKGIVGYCMKEPIVVSNAEQLKNKEIGPKVGVLAQTTQAQENFAKVVEALLTVAYECRIYNTICKATQSRQTAAVEMANAVDVMFVVGGKNSANTARLAELCRTSGATTYHIESADEIVPEMVRGKERIGITAGASTPRSHVDAVRAALEQLGS